MLTVNVKTLVGLVYVQLYPPKREDFWLYDEVDGHSLNLSHDWKTLALCRAAGSRQAWPTDLDCA